MYLNEVDIIRGHSLRDTNLELFRILTMLLIIAHHYVVNSGLISVDGPVYADPLSWRSLFLICFGAWGKIGINCFVLITGYYMCESHITVRKFLKLLLEVMFYRVAISMLFWLTGYESFSLNGLARVFIPIRSIGDGFTSAYLVFYLFIPFLNILIHNVSERQYVYLLLLCGFMYVFLGTVPGFSVTMNYVSWFMVIYFIGGYLRRYPKKHSKDEAFWRRNSVIIIIIDLLSIFAGTWVGVQIGKRGSYFFVSDSNTLLAVATGISLFMWFKNLHIKHNTIINKIASSTFGVLLIHANSDTMRRWLWKDVLDNVGHYEARLMPLYAIGCVVGIFIVCSVLDQIRMEVLEKPVLERLDGKLEGVKSKYLQFESKLMS